MVIGTGTPVLVRRAGRTVAGCAALLAVVYLLAVRTTPGQRFEDEVLHAGDRVAGGRGDLVATGALALVSGVTLTAVLLVVLVIGVLRRCLPAAFAAIAVVGAVVATAEIVQRLVLRPYLLDSGPRREDQSFPSGHAAVAMSVMCALVLVMPTRHRVPTVLIGSVWATSITVATVIANWHRPSDTIGSGLIVVGCFAAAGGMLAWRGAAHEHHPTLGERRLRRVVVAVAAVATVVAVVAVGYAVAGDAAIAFGSGESGSGAAQRFAGRAIAVASGTTVTAAMLALIARVSFDRAPAAVDTSELLRSSDA